MKFLRSKGEKAGRRVRGAELVLIGTALITSKWILGFLAPLVLAGYGLYRWLIRKSYGDGITLAAVEPFVAAAQVFSATGGSLDSICIGNADCFIRRNFNDPWK